MNTELHFNNGSFKIMQIADAQEFPRVSPDTVRLIELAVQAEKPDLIIFTGDQVYGIHPRLWGKDAEKKIRNVIKQLLSPVVKEGVPFAVTFGNHDSESGIPNERQAGFYAEYPGFVRGERRSESDPGTFRIPVFGSEGRETLAVYAFDTHGSAYGSEKNGVNPEQLKWFKESRQTKNKPPAIVFQHIPVQEYYNVIKKINKREHGAVEAFGARKNTFYILPEELKRDGGFMKESPAVPKVNNGEFDALKGDGAVLALCAGHDHNNSFVAVHRGIKLIYTQGAGFHVYGPGLKRGVRLFVFDENSPDTFITHTRTWDSLTSEKPKEFLLEEFLSRTPSSFEQGVSIVKRALPFFALAGAGAALTAYLAVKNKKN